MADRRAELSRRQLLELLNAGVLTSIAGCSQQEADQSFSPTSSVTQPAPETSTRPVQTETNTQTAPEEATETPSETQSGPVWTPREPPGELPPSEVIGVTHSEGRYHFTDEDFLNEGAKKIADLGTNVIKIWFHRIDEKYPYNSNWRDSYGSMVEVAKTDYAKELFSRPFSTFIILAHSHTWGEWLDFQSGVNSIEMEEIRTRFANLTEHLLSTYDGTGKTFVLQHWEGDNLAQENRNDPLPELIAENFRRWLTARQEGVEQARDTIQSDVTVLHAPEVNFVLDAKNSGTARVINEVIPEVEVDLVSYSAWELGDQLNGEGWAPGHNGQKQFDEAETVVRETLDYIESKTPDPNDYVLGSLTDRQSNIYLGEFGSPFQEKGSETAMRIIRTVLENSLDWGVRWAIYWQVYGNEKIVEGEVTENDDVRGFYLIRPDGTLAPSWEYLKSLLQSNKTF